jgi:uncharacterized protein (DUF1499 family)
MLILKWLVIVTVVLIVCAIAAGQLGLLKGRAPTDLGAQGGRLKGLSSTPNSISSQAALYPDHPQQRYSTIAPLALRGDGLATLAKIKAIVEAMNGSKIIKSEPAYLYAEFTTPLMKYVDDVEFWFDPSANVIQVRSASRLGKSDLGANRKRVEAVRAALVAAPN